MRVLLASLTAAAALAASAGQDGATQAYVHASRLAVRAQPAPAAAVGGYVTTNTRVEVEQRAGEWCRVRSATPPVSGFVVCRFLGDAPLTLEAVTARLGDQKLSPREALDWESRGFWIAPSVRRLETVGASMSDVLLSDDHRSREMQSGDAFRQPNAEFDAMKARLAAGAIPDARDSRPRSIEGSERYYWEPVELALKRTPLPPAAPSHFRADEPLFAIALGPFGLDRQGGIAVGLADALSAVHQVPLRMRVLAPAGFYHGGPIGVWDVSAVGVTFAKPVTLHAVTARGEATGLEISLVRAKVGNQPCTGSAMSVAARRVNNRWSAATLAWAGKPPTAQPTVDRTQSAGKNKHERLTVESVDLNGDRIPDFLAWTGLAPAVVNEPGDVPWKAVFANLEGKWVLVGFAQGEDCT